MLASANLVVYQSVDLGLVTDNSQSGDVFELLGQSVERSVGLW